METVKLNGLEWMIDNLSEHGGTEINGNWYYTWEQAMNAAKKIGYGWRMPTEEEFIALCNLESAWDEERKGRWFGENKELFLPALGCLNYLGEIMEFGFYWSNHIKGQEVYVKCLKFTDEVINPSAIFYKRNCSSVRLVRDIKNENNPKKVYALFEGYGTGKFEPLIGVFSTYEKAKEAKTFLDDTKNCPHFIVETKMDETFLK